MKKELIECGKIVSTQGIRGEVRVTPWCDSASFLCEIKTFFAKGGELKLISEGARVNKNVVVIKFAGVNSVEEAQALRNHVLYIERKNIKLEEGSYLVRDLIGLSVINAETKKEYGKLCDVTQTGANDVYHIKTQEGKQLLFPAIKDVIKKTDIDSDVMEILPLKGLFDDED